MWKNCKFIFVLLAELVLLFQITMPQNYYNSYCIHTNPGAPEKHDATSNEANKHSHASNNLFHTNTKSFISTPKTSIHRILFVTLFVITKKTQTSVLLAIFSINDSVIDQHYHSIKPFFRGPPSVA